VLAARAFELEDNLLGDLRFLLEDGLLLSSETFLLVVVSTSSLGEEAFLAFLVLRDFMLGVLLAVVGTVGVAGLGHLHHFDRLYIY